MISQGISQDYQDTIFLIRKDFILRTVLVGNPNSSVECVCTYTTTKPSMYVLLRLLHHDMFSSAMFLFFTAKFPRGHLHR